MYPLFIIHSEHDYTPQKSLSWALNLSVERYTRQRSGPDNGEHRRKADATVPDRQTNFYFEDFKSQSG
jgi:hypothetical protein